MRMRAVRRVFSHVPIHAVLITIAIIWMLPTLGVLVTSFRAPQDVYGTGWWTVFAHIGRTGQFTITNYVEVIFRQGMGRAFLNSLFISIPGTVIPVTIAAFAAFAFSWMRFRGRNILFMIVVALLIIPLQMTFIPVLRIFNKLGIAGTFPGIWFAHTGYGLPLAVYLLHNFMSSLPKDLFDSAAIDGATTLQTFLRIVVPLSVPAIASVIIFQFVWVWNDLLVALIYLGGSPNVAPVTLKIANLVGSRGQDWQILTAAAFVSMALPLVVFFSLQRYFVRGILAGSIKG
jgi:alpha-glucoside transport system permease protein